MKLHHLFVSCVIMTSWVPQSSHGYNILMALLLESKSVHNLFSGLARDLVAANHTVTLVTSYNASFSHENFVNLNVLGGGAPIESNLFVNRDPQSMSKVAYDMINYVGTEMWENEEVWNLWANRNSFDAIITLPMSNGIFMPFAFNFTGQLMFLVQPGIDYFAIAADGNWLSPSVVSSAFVPYDENMDFFERTLNIVSLLLYKYLLWNPLIQQETALLKKYFPDVEDISRYYENGALTLVNSHPALDGPVPLLPGQVQIGTLNARPPKQLPKDLEDFMASSGDHGVIYFSLGSFIKGKDIPQQAKMAFVEAFRRVPQNVIWGYQGDDLDLPHNVLTRPWLPQQDILGHPKTRVYISHCGIQSTQEARYHGVPVLAVPITFDQPRNAARMVRKKIALSLSWDTLTADDIVAALDQLVNDTSYAENMRQLSAVLQDQKETPGQRAVWWIEYVIRHKGAPHLQYTGKRLHFLQYICADVLAFLFLCFYISYRLVKALVLLAWHAWGNKAQATKLKKH